MKRPGSEVIFTRFYDEWLLNSSIDELEKYLLAQATEGDAADWHILAAFYLKRGQEADALKAYQSATDLAPEDGSLWLSRADSAKALQDYEQALENLDRALSCELTDPQTLKARRLKGSCLALSGRNQEANLVWQKLLSDFPSDHELMEDLIDLQIGEGMLDEALSTALELVEASKDPYQKALYQIDVGEIYIRKEERRKAQAHLAGLIDKVGADSWLEKEILAKLDLLVAGMNDLTEAHRFYRELSQRYPQRVGIWKHRIQALAATGDVDAAIEQYQELLRLTPGDRQNHEAFIDFLESNERLEHAAENSRKLCELYPKDAELRLRHAALLDRIGDRAALLVALQSYEALLGESPNDRLQVARVYDQFGFFDQSGAIYQALAEANSKDVESVENYAIWLFNQGKEDRAVELLESLATEVSRESLVRICRTLAGEFQGEKAYALLKSRIDDFKTDSLYLLELSNMALAQSVPEEALGWVRTLVLKAESPFELSSAVNLAVRVIQQAEQVDALLAEFENAGKLNLQELSLKAHLENLRGDSLSADESIEQMRQRGGVIAYSEISRLLEMQGRLEESIGAMEKLLSMEAGRNPLNLRRIVDLLQQSGAWDRAVEYVSMWKSVTPGDPKVWLREADLLEAAGRTKEAIQQMRRGLYKFEGDLELTLRLASLYWSARDFAEAARIYWRLYNQEEKDSERLRWVRELARLNRERGTTDELIEKLTTIRKQQRESVFPLLALAEVYQENNYSELYRETLVAASNLQPDNPELLRRVASLHENYGDLDAAEQALQRLVRVDGEGANINTLSGFYLRMGETEKAYNLIFQSAPSGGHGPRDLESIIDSLAASGEWEIALEQAEAAAAQFPDDWRLGYLLGTCLEANGQYRKAFQRWLALLGPQKAISGLAQPTQTKRHSYYGYQAQLLQELESEAGKILKGSRATFSYLNPRSNRPPVYGAGLSAFGMQTITLPADPESLRSMCALQMAAVASEWPEEKRLQAGQIMRQAGVDCAPILIALNGGRYPRSMPVRLMAYVEDNPGDVDALPLLLSYIHRGSFIPEETLKRGFDSYVDKNPAIASEFALALVMREVDESGPYLEHIVTNVSYEDDFAISQSNQLLRRLIAYAYNDSGSGTDSLLGESQVETLMEALETYYYGADAESTEMKKIMSQVQSFDVLAMFYVQQRATKKFIGVLEEQLSRIENFSKTSAGAGLNMHSMRSRSHGNLQLQMPIFEEAYLGLGNPAITRYLAKPGATNLGYRGAALQDEDWQDLDLVSQVGQFTRPELQILVYWAADDLEGCEKAFKHLLAEGAEPHQLYVYAAWLLEVKNDKLAAVQALTQAAKHPRASSSRSNYEQGIVAIVLEMAREQELKSIDEEALESARSAALRLRKSFAIQSHQQQIFVNILQELGLEEEADRMVKAQKRSTNFAMNSGSRISLAPGSSRRSNPMDRITELAGEGKTEAAASAAVREIRRVIQQGSFYNPPQLKQIVQRINGTRLFDEVLQRFDPGESMSRRRMETYALLLDQFDRVEQAREIWAALHEQRPNEPKYLLELILLEGEESRKQTIQKLTQLDPVLENKVGEWIIQKMNYSVRNQDFESWMALFEFVETYLEALNPETEGYRNLSWAPFYAVNAASSVYLQSISFGDLLRSDQNRRSGDEATRARRREGFIRIVEALQRHPQTSEEAFMLRYAFDKTQGNRIKKEIYEPLALETIKNKAELKSGSYAQVYFASYSSRWTFVSQGGHHHGSRRLEDEMSPLAYLIQLYHNEADKGVSKLQELHDKLAEENPELAATIENYVDFVGMDKAEFVQACKEWCEELGYSYGSNDYKLDILPYLIRAREFDGETLLDLIQEIQGPLFVQRNSRRLNQFVEKITGLLSGLNDVELFERWLDSVTVEFIGPKEGWQEYLSQWGWGRQYYGGNHPAYKIRMLRQLLSHIATQERDLAITTYRFTKKHKIGMRSHSVYQFRKNLSEAFDSVETAIAWCKSQGLLSSLENFDTLVILDEQMFRDPPSGGASNQIPLLPQNRNASVYEYALSHISFSGDDKKKKRKAFIKELKERGFGGMFLAAVLERSSGKKIALEALEGKLDDVRNMSETDQVELAFLYQYWLKDSIVDEASHPALYYLQSRLFDSLKEEATAYLADDSAIDPGQIYRERQKIQAWVSSLLPFDTEICLRLYRDWVKASKRASNMSMNYSSSQVMNNNRSILSQALRPFRNSIEGLKPSVQFIAALLEEDFGDSFGDLYYMSYQVRDSWRSAIDAREKEAAKMDVNQASVYIPELLSEYDAFWETETEAQFAALTLWSYAIERMRANDKEIEDLLTWATGVEPEASLSHRTFAAAITALAAKEDREREGGPDRTVALLGSDELDLQIRLTFLRCISSSQLRDFMKEDVELGRLFALTVKDFIEAGHEPLGRDIINSLEQLPDSNVSDGNRDAFKACFAALQDHAPKAFGRGDQNEMKKYYSAVAKIAVNIGDLDAAKNLVTSHHWALQGNSVLFVEMIRAGEFHAALQLMPDAHDFKLDNSIRYDAPLHEKLPPFLELVSNEKLRFRAKAALELLRDDNDLKEAEIPDQKTRAHSLIRALEPGDTLLDPELLNEIGKHIAETKLMIDHIKEAVGDLDIKIVIEHANDHSFGRTQMARAELDLIEKLLAYETKSGNIDRLAKQVFGLEDYMHDRNVQRSYKDLKKLFDGYLKTVLGQGNKKALVNAAPLAESMLNMAYSESSTSRDHLPYFSYLLTKLADQSAASANATLPETTLDRIQKLEEGWEQPEKIFSLVDELAGGGSGDTEKKGRQKTIQLMLGDEAYIEKVWVTSADALRDSLSYSSNYETEDLIAVIPAVLSKTHPREPWLAMVLADAYLQKDDQVKEAKEWLNYAIEAAQRHPDLMDVSSEAALHLAKISLENDNDAEAAQKYLEQISLDSLPKKMKADAERLKERASAATVTD